MAIFPGKSIRLAVLITCHDRKLTTISCLRALFDNSLPTEFLLDVFLVDDGSTDGTADAVRALFPNVRVFSEKGNLFWCRGMHKAFAVAAQDHYDYYLWLNDDTILQTDAVKRLLECAEVHGHRKPVIVVGATVSSETGEPTYGGVRRRSRIRPVKFDRITPADVAQQCDSMTGNIVLIPASIAKTVGNLDPAFEHAMGDIDYALRARRQGFEIWTGPGVFGFCNSNPISGSYQDSSVGLLQRWQQMLSRKGLPWKSWMVLTRRHAGPFWLLYFVWPYLRLVFQFRRRP